MELGDWDHLLRRVCCGIRGGGLRLAGGWGFVVIRSWLLLRFNGRRRQGRRLFVVFWSVSSLSCAPLGMSLILSPCRIPLPAVAGIRYPGPSSVMTFVALWRLSVMMFVALFDLYGICHVMTFVANYDICRLWGLSQSSFDPFTWGLGPTYDQWADEWYRGGWSTGTGPKSAQYTPVL